MGGRSHFKGFRFNGSNPSEFISQFAFDVGFNGGVRVGVADTDGDGRDEILIAAGPGAGPNIKIFRYTGAGVEQSLSAWAFTAPTPGMTFQQAPYFDSGISGIYISGANVDGLPGAELLVGAGQGGGSHVKIFKVNGGSLQELDSFFAFQAGFNGGARVAAADFDNNGVIDLLVGTGPGLEGRIKAYRFLSTFNRQELGEISPLSGYSGGVFVGG